MSPETASCSPADTSKTSPHDTAQPGRDPHLESAFERLIGYQATPRDRARLHRVRDSLGLHPNDALWEVLIALQYYYSLYERFPAMIRGAARELLIECKNESDRHIAQAKQQVQHGTDAAAEVAQAAVAAHASLEKTIQQSARLIALAAGFATRWPWVLGVGWRGGDGGGVDPHRRGRLGLRAPAGLRGRLHGGLCRGDATATELHSPTGTRALAAMRTASFFTYIGPGRISIAC